MNVMREILVFLAIRSCIKILANNIKIDTVDVLQLIEN